MNCPVCGKAMIVRNFGVNVDVCLDGCKGMWFDWAELLMLDEENEGLGRALQAALAEPRTNDAGRGQLNCPKCGVPMRAHRYKRAHVVMVDECYNCGGFFLDSGELKEIRDHYLTDAEFQDYVSGIVDGVPEYQEGQEELAELKRRRQAVQKYTRWLRLGYWKGKFLPED